jgi:hypothetical protein
VDQGPHCRGLTITFRHTTLDRTPLDERSSRCQDFYIKSHTHKRETKIIPAGFEPAIVVSEQLQAHALDRAALLLLLLLLIRRQLEVLHTHKNGTYSDVPPILVDGSGESEARSSPSEHEKFSGAL